MKSKILGVIGLIFLIINQLMLLGGNELIQKQQPIDYAHWLLLIGVILCLSLNTVFSNNHFGNTATILTSLGVIALIGQATIDFVWWSYGDNYAGMDDLTRQLMSRPSIRIPFMTIGPALFYLGLATHAGKLIRKIPVWSIATWMGVLVIALGSFAFDSRISIVLGHIILTISIAILIFKKDIELST